MGKEQFPKIKEDVVDKTFRIYNEIESLLQSSNIITYRKPFTSVIWYLVKKGIL